MTVHSKAAVVRGMAYSMVVYQAIRRRVSEGRRVFFVLPCFAN